MSGNDLAKCGSDSLRGSNVAASPNYNATCVDLFAGCGGLSLGLEQAGFKPLLVSELNDDARKTYMANRKSLAGDLIEEGNIYDLNNNRLKRLRQGWGEVDLVAGGPPCQGFSGIGHRRSHSVDKRDIPSNHLYEEMIRVIRALQPKAFLFENVRGLLNSKWDDTGKKIWPDILKAFNSLNRYTVRPTLVRSFDYGVPQNRPRVLLIGVRNTILPHARGSYPDDAVEAGLLPGKTGVAPDLEKLFGDLLDDNYDHNLITEKYPHRATHKVHRIMRKKGLMRREGHPLKEQVYSNHKKSIQEKFNFMIEKKIRSMKDMPEKFRTNKFSQRVLPRRWDEVGGTPNLTATSLPDDYVHYSQPRTLTVREWARLQGFPDWYEFCGKRTTGGARRAGNPNEGNWDREVPKYTQIGNAVPVPLAEAVGNHILEKFIK